MFVNNNKHLQVIKECVSLSISNNVVGMDLKLAHTPRLNMHSSVKICNTHVNNPHNKLQRKILLDITIYKQCTFHVNNSILNQHTLQWGNTGRVLVHRNNHPTLPK